MRSWRLPRFCDVGEPHMLGENVALEGPARRQHRDTAKGVGLGIYIVQGGLRIAHQHAEFELHYVGPVGHRAWDADKVLRQAFPGRVDSVIDLEVLNTLRYR